MKFIAKKINFHCVLLLLLSSSSSSSSPVTRPFSPAYLPLKQLRSPPLRLQASHFSTFRIMCDVPSTVVLCSEPIESLPGTVSKFFLKPSVVFHWLQLLPVQFYISCSTFVVSFIYFLVCFLSRNVPVHWYGHICVHSLLLLLLLYNMYVSCHRYFFLVLLLNQR